MFEKLFEKLPLNGWKTQLGWLLQFAPMVVPTLFGPAKDVVEKVGQVLLAVGVLHKAIKEIKK